MGILYVSIFYPASFTISLICISTGNDIADRLDALLWGYPELSSLFVEEVKNVLAAHRRRRRLRYMRWEAERLSCIEAWEVLKVCN